MLHFRFAFAPLTALLLFSNAQTISARQSISATPPLSGFSGDWTETKQAASGPPMRLRLSQSGTQLTVWQTYTDTFSDPVATATITNGVATWAKRQSCAERFQSLGFDYSNAGRNTYSLSFVQAEGQPRPVLVYTQVTEWNAPCGGHKIGTEGQQKLLSATN